jgi:metallo-beta-lactamase family protein
MKIHFYGAAQDVTGSQYLLEINGKRLLMECGMYQGHRQDTYDRNLNFRFNIDSLDAAILSHAHIDHSGNLPNLIKQGYEGPIYTSSATAKLADIMLRDSGHIQEDDAGYINKKRDLRKEPPIDPIYTMEDAARTSDHFKAVTYGESFEPIPGVHAHLEDAGHILGSAAIVLDVQEDGREYRFWFSGDIGRYNLPLLKDPVFPKAADYVMMECTYGDSPKPNADEAYGKLKDMVLRTFNRGGKVIIPAFAVGRTQELIYCFNKLISDKEIPPFPVYVDSPLATQTTRIFEQFPEYLDMETHQFESVEHHPALEFSQLHFVASVEESKSLNERHDPMVIISASGMAEFGRILHHLKNNIEDKRNTVAIVGWTAPYTLGRRLVEKQPVVRIYGQSYTLAAEVVEIHAFSAHAGQDTLLQYAQSSQATLKRVILVHGEQKQADALRAKFSEVHINDVVYPSLYDSMEI